MHIITIIVTRSKSCSVKTLHSILKLNIKTITKGSKNEILFIEDDTLSKIDVIQKCMKRCDRIFFIDFGISVDEDSLDQVLEKHDNIGCLVFPGVKEGIDWEMFSEKVKNDSDEPCTQMGLNFDTDVGKKISENIYNVNNSNARSWILNTKNVFKTIKDRKTGNIKLYPNMLNKFIEQNVKVCAFTASKLTFTYTHECVSNILNAAGVKVN